MLNDFWTSLKAQLYERTTSPLLGTLAVSWLAWNHRLLVVLVAGEPFPDRFAYIDQVLYPDRLATFLFVGVYPFVTSLVFLFVYPFPAKWVFKFWRRQQKELKEIRQRIEDETPLTIEESQRIRRRLIEVRTEYENQLRQSSEEADQLREALRNEQEQKESLNEELAQLRSTAKDPNGTTPDQALQQTLDEPISEESLMEYSRRRFSDLPPSDRVTKMLLKDLDRDRYKTLRDIDAAVASAKEAVRAYMEEKPEVFRYGTDQITKSLGFVDEQFRDQHGFSSETRDAFQRHAGKVRRMQ